MQTLKSLEADGRHFGIILQQICLNFPLKTEYHPESVNEDYLIEDVLQTSLDQRITLKESKLNFDFPKIAAAKKGIINVEQYKAMFFKTEKKVKRN